jgi:hypothetical protein
MDTCFSEELNETEQAIIKTLTFLNSNGKCETVKRQTEWKLRQISTGKYIVNGQVKTVDIFDPESVKEYVANALKRNGQPPKSATKNKLLTAYRYFCEENNIPLDKPYYKVEEEIPLIPTTENVNLIINTATKNYAVIFTILAETGAEGKELEKTPSRSVDKAQGIINIVGTKGHDSGSYKLKDQTAEMLRVYLYKRTEEYPFPLSKQTQEAWRKTRARAAKKLCKPELNQIPLRNLRNYSGAQNYFTFKDPIDTMRHLRHKKLETTMHYIRGIPRATECKFVTKVVTTAEEACDLLAQGFKEQSIFGDKHIFAKPK